MLEEFKKFALRGNAVDLAIGVIIGAAFGATVNSVVGDILSPIIGAVTGGFDFSNYFIPLSSNVTADSLVEAKKQGAVLAWGNFLTVVINFIIIAWILFIVVKVMNRMIQSEPPQYRPKTPNGRGTDGMAVLCISQMKATAVKPTVAHIGSRTPAR